MTQSFEKVGTVSSASVHKGTGRTWDQWIALLDKAGASGWTHQEIVAYLKKKHRLTPWWQQGVTTGYEVATGRREQGQSLKGEYQVTCTASLSIGAKAAWKLISSPEGLGCWLRPLSDFLAPKQVFESEGGIFGEVRTMKAGRQVRIRWQNEDWPKPTTVQVVVIPRPKSKCILAIMHDGFVDVRTREKMRVHWKAVLAELRSRSAKSTSSKT